MKNYLVCIRFNGYYFNGTQINPNYETIQGIFEKLLTNFFSNETVSIKTCSRLDKHVHAEKFFFNFKVEKEIVTSKLMFYLNNFTPESIEVLYIKEVDLSFNSRYNAIEKTYEYRIKFINKDVFNYETTFLSTYKLKTDKNLPFDLLIGTHNFINFCSAEEKQDSYLNTVDSFTMNFDKDYNVYIFKVVGRRFFRYQVRYMVGIIYEIMIGRKSVDDLKEMLQETRYTKPRLLLPGNGLTLKDVAFANLIEENK